MVNLFGQGTPFGFSIPLSCSLIPLFQGWLAKFAVGGTEVRDESWICWRKRNFRHTPRPISGCSI